MAFTRKNTIRLSLFLTVTLLVAIIAWFSTVLFPIDVEASKESVKIRNSLIAKVASVDELNWIPSKIPEGYLLESMKSPDYFVQISEMLFHGNNIQRSNFQKALVIARHLKSVPNNGRAIMSNARDSHGKIVKFGRGYCSDFTQVFNAISIASGIPVREWGVSFDGFSGEGHAFNEVYDNDLDKWVFVDSFWSFYVRDAATGAPLSAIQFRDALLSDRPDTQIEVMPIAGAHFGFKTKQQAISYYRKGANQLYLYWGNNVFSYESHPLVRMFAPISRGLEQAVGILVGVHPAIRILTHKSNMALVSDLFSKKKLVYVLISLTLVLSFINIILAIYYRNLVRVKTKLSDTLYESPKSV